MAKALFSPPPFAPGEKVAKALELGLLALKSDSVAFDATSPVELFEVPANTLVLEVIVDVETAFDGTTPTVTIGDGADADGFLDAAAVGIAVAGLKSSRQDAQPYSFGKEYTAADTIDATIAVTDTTAGAFSVWVIYKPLSDKAL